MNLWLNGSLWNQKRFFYGIAVKNLWSTFIFKSVAWKSMRSNVVSNPTDTYCQCWAVTSYCNLVTVIILLFAVTSSVTNY